jgi:hypothetical protein
MGLFGGSSSSSNTTNTSTEVVSGSVGISGANQGYVLSGVKNSTVNVTDGGSVAAALSAMTSAGDNVTSMAKSMVTTSADLSKYAIDSNSTLGVKALVNAQQATTDAMDIMKNISLSSDAGTTQQLSKYFMYGAVALAVAFVMRGKM